ncbi:MAG TPA: DUF4335 domain-containing protein, partial [Stenomitos sp.]
MPIQRQYSLPNCVLILEGLSSSPDRAGGDRPELSILTRFECYFAREKQAIIGGRELLESLFRATTNCVQYVISGLQSSTHRKGVDGVKIEKDAEGGFHLLVPAELMFQGTPEATDKSDLKLHLSSIQLFDLMEAMDQLAADQQTLPDLTTAIQPRSRSEVVADRSALEQSASVALGTVSVAVAAAAVFFIPAPKLTTPPKQLQNSP